MKTYVLCLETERGVLTLNCYVTQKNHVRDEMGGVKPELVVIVPAIQKLSKVIDSGLKLHEWAYRTVRTIYHIYRQKNGQ